MQRQQNSDKHFTTSVSPANHLPHNNGFNETLYDVEKDGEPLLNQHPTAPKMCDHTNGTLKIGSNGYPGPPNLPPPKQKAAPV